MRIHSNVLQFTDIRRAHDGLAGVYATVSQHGSRSHARSFEVSLEGNGYARNTGRYGADQSGDSAATWDEWGVFLGRLYVLDPEMIVGTPKNPIYSGAEHFNWSTGNRFAPTATLRHDDSLSVAYVTQDVQLPADTHKRHAWNYAEVNVTGRYSVSTCKGSKGKPCSAVRRFMHYGYSFSDLQTQEA